MTKRFKKYLMYKIGYPMIIAILTFIVIVYLVKNEIIN
jgi:hypothetical protein